MKIAQSDELIDEQYAEVLDVEDTINESNNTNNNELQNYTTPLISVHCHNVTKATKTVTFHHDVKPSSTLHLISSTTYTPPLDQSQPQQMPTPTIQAVINSGASHTMTSNIEIFENITHFPSNSDQPTAIVGDNTTSLNIHGYGMINIIVHGHRLQLMIYYIPKLGATLISTKQHMKSKGCYFHAEASNTILMFPIFFMHPRIAT